MPDDAVTTSTHPRSLDSVKHRDRYVADLVAHLEPRLIATRRELHQHPELSNREVRTSRFLVHRLREIGGFELRTNVAHHGIVATLHGRQPGKVVGIRADMDALPIDEPPGLPFASTVPGVMHACGHDVHMTVALGTAEVLARLRQHFCGTVRFFFQPAEEGPPPGEAGGAKLMLDEGALEPQRPDAMFALHCYPPLAAGQLGYNEGVMMSSCDRFTITVRGRMAHGAYPHRGVDAIVVASTIVMMLQTIRSRMIDAQQPMVLTVGRMQGGRRYNIVADEVVMEGTVRAFDETVRTETEHLIHQIVSNAAAGSGASCDIRYERLVPPLVNDQSLVRQMLPTLQRVIGAERVIEHAPRMGAEDFAYFACAVPAMFYSLGVSNPAAGIEGDIHTPRFAVDEVCIATGVRAMSALALDFLAA
ncbi:MULTISPECIES: M20 metallopeptidase family protein [Chloracidobacterium]|jgi:amidohydrolase|uniref:Amidohydrolase n=1 Tax=Chloracidobacterium thermophilum (strain B) TaxID=981222 RepID=G2LJT1_CHLTF|nr:MULTISPECIES: M20 family metallopeptidase [Chloracidobacterium]AEP13098.1 amidohydrolase [Chloracidobacterium thermophilum B]QUV80364.1 amidohydrolase [Chloracidobacterium thermophilum]QUV83107.1 amidohydrolase [Chloracidobacterium sp. D]